MSMYLVLEKNAFDKEVICKGVFGGRIKAKGHADYLNNLIKNDSEWNIVVTSTQFNKKYKKHATA